MNPDIWHNCLQHIENRLNSSEFSTWIHPLQAQTDTSGLIVLAPNAIIRDWVSRNYRPHITEALDSCGYGGQHFRVEVGTLSAALSAGDAAGPSSAARENGAAPIARENGAAPLARENGAAPLARENGAAPFARENGAAPLAGENGAAPLARENGAAPLARESGAVPLARENGAAPLAGENGAAPLARESGAVPLARENGAAPLARENGAAPLARRNGTPSFSTRGGPRAAQRRHSPPAPAAREATGVERDLVPEYTFENFVEGHSNRLARAHAMQIASSGGKISSSRNPLVICGGVGLGKTHLMHAAGNALRCSRPDMNIVYCSAEDFVNSMVSSIRLNAMPEFKRHYRSAQVLLIDDIQFFADKETSQEELFHTVDTLLQRRQQIIITCDRQPREMDGLPARLRSRFDNGLVIIIESPDLETRAAILIQKAAAMNLTLPEDCALFIARELCSNVRELVGALNRVSASVDFYGRAIDLDLVRDALSDILAVHNRQVRMQDIKAKAAEYFGVRMSLLHAPTRTRPVVRARQVAMALARELTSHSLPSIGDAFGGRDHTTVMHACRQITELRRRDPEIERAYSNLRRLLTA